MGPFTGDQKLAFWINAYNAYTLKLVLDHYPLKSIRSIGFLPGAAFIARHAAPGLSMALGSAPVRVELLGYDWSLNGK
jgi:hypothetical protein